jgi:archaellum component FlaG (FlaF/FlaG flagellin family)
MRAVHIALVGAFLAGTPAYATTLNLNDFVLFAGIGPVSIGNNTNIYSGAVGTNGSITTGTGVTVNDLDAGGNILTSNNSTVRSGSNVIAGGNYTTGTGVNLNGVNVTLGGSKLGSAPATGPASLTTGVTIPAKPFAAGSPYQLPTLPPGGIGSPSSAALGNVTTEPVGTLAPGDYGALSLANNKTLNLTAGTYHFTSFSIGTGSDINFDLTGGAINVLVDGNISISNSTTWTPSNGDASDIFWEAYGNVTIGTGAEVYGTIFASGVAALGKDENLNNNGMFTGQYLATGGISIGTGTKFNLLVNDRFISNENHLGATPIPSALPLFGTGLGIIGLLGWRRKRKAAARVA